MRTHRPMPSTETISIAMCTVMRCDYQDFREAVDKL